MNYYDEEITISGPDSRNLNHFKMERLPSSSSSRGIGGTSGGIRMSAAAGGSSRSRGRLQRGLGRSTDDDGLLQDIIDHDDEDDDDDDDDYSEMQKPAMMVGEKSTAVGQGSTTQRPQTRPGSTRSSQRLPAKPFERSESESDGTVTPQGGINVGNRSLGAQPTIKPDVQLSIVPEKWEQLALPAELKQIFPYILKYTPQNIETRYHLQPFIPEFVPAVGDVDAFLKVTVPPLMKPERQQEITDHLRRMGLHFLDEPSGEQSEPSLLNMKLRSVLTGSSANRSSATATLIPTAKSAKDIDKWINEVEKIHMTHGVNETQPRKDIEPLLLDWPRSYADAGAALQDAYQRCLQDDDVARYVRTLCEQFDVDAPLETQTDYILNVQTLFALYLAANQAWE